MALLHVSSVALVWMFPLVANVWLSTPEPIQVCVFVLPRAVGGPAASGAGGTEQGPG